VRAIADFDSRFLDRRMAGEIRAHQVSVPGPIILAVGGRVDSHEPSPRLQVRLQGGLLALVQDISRGVEKDDRVIAGQGLRGEPGRVLRCIYTKTV
jgi:hypothetical protein